MFTAREKQTILDALWAFEPQLGSEHVPPTGLADLCNRVAAIDALDDRCIWRVVIVYDDPRAGTWLGPLEPLSAAQARLKVEAARAHGSVSLTRYL